MEADLLEMEQDKPRQPFMCVVIHQTTARAKEYDLSRILNLSDFAISQWEEGDEDDDGADRDHEETNNALANVAAPSSTEADSIDVHRTITEVESDAVGLVATSSSDELQDEIAPDGFIESCVVYECHPSILSLNIVSNRKKKQSVVDTATTIMLPNMIRMPVELDSSIDYGEMDSSLVDLFIVCDHVSFEPPSASVIEQQVDFLKKNNGVQVRVTLVGPGSPQVERRFSNENMSHLSRQLIAFRIPEKSRITATGFMIIDWPSFANGYFSMNPDTPIVFHQNEEADFTIQLYSDAELLDE
jgi:hypothetical protein